MILLEEIKIDIIEQNAIAEINYSLVGSKRDDDRYKSCLSSFYYYDTDEEQIASIVLSLIKGHYFMDGNKRTAYAVLMILSEFNNIPIKKSDEQIAKIMIDIAENDYPVDKVAKLIFG